jgi:hypothetical protein
MLWTNADRRRFKVQLREIMLRENCNVVDDLVDVIDKTLLVYGSRLHEVQIMLHLERLLNFFSKIDFKNMRRANGKPFDKMALLAECLTEWVGNCIEGSGVAG